MSHGRRAARALVAGLYPLLDDGVLGLGAFSAHARVLREAGIRVMQLRLKHRTDVERLEVIRGVIAALHGWDGLLVIDDRADLAAIAHAEAGAPGPTIGLHLGQTDLPPALARAIVGPEVLIGWSTHDLAQVAAAADLPVDYLGFGPVFPTRTKRDPDPVVGLPTLAAACRATPLPIVAIGGLSLPSLPDVFATGVASAAVVSMLWPPEVANRCNTDDEALSALSSRARAAMEAFS